MLEIEGDTMSKGTNQKLKLFYLLKKVLKAAGLDPQKYDF
jgi:hypothetical protein